MVRLWTGVLILTFLMLVATTAPAFAQQFPEVANLTPFSVETNFMSLAGYLRWLVFTQTSQWISMPEAARVVSEQLAVATR